MLLCVLMHFRFFMLWTVCLAAVSTGSAADDPWFGIKVVDQDTGRGVPMIELKTVNHVRHLTDSNGYIAFHEPGLMGSNLFFHVSGHGYEFRKDGFGFRGVRLQAIPGGEARIKVKRVNIAERLYRITGAGIYRDSLLLKKPVPITAPVLNGSVFGQDSVNAIPYRGRIHWFWGNSNRPDYPLGNFQTSGATSLPPGKGGLNPSQGIDLNYFVNDKGFSRRMAPLKGKGVVWIFGLVEVDGNLIGHYTRMKNLGTMLEHGLVRFNDERNEFEKLKEFGLANRRATLKAHPIRHHDAGRDWFIIPQPLPNLRVPANLKSVQDQNSYEGYSCLEPGEGFAGKESKVHRNDDGQVVYDWKRGTQPTGPAEERQLIQRGLLDADDASFLPKNVASGKIVAIHFSTVRWNEFRQRWVMIGTQAGGDSYLGEVWYGEAKQPTGPWRKVRKIVTHDSYSFYNPCHHAFFDQDNGRRIYFEGTYTSMFSAAKSKTPRYDYNQIMYRLDLADPRLRDARVD